MPLNIPLHDFFQMGMEAGSIGNQLGPSLQHNQDLAVQTAPAASQAMTAANEAPSNIAYKQAATAKTNTENALLTDPNAKQKEINLKMFEAYYKAIGDLGPAIMKAAPNDPDMQKKLFLLHKSKLDQAFGLTPVDPAKESLKQGIMAFLSKAGISSGTTPAKLGTSLTKAVA